MRVCFIVGTLGRGGAERQLVYMLRTLKDEGICTKVLCLTSGESYEKEIKNLGVDIEWIGSSGNRPIRLGRAIKAARKFRAEIIQSSHFYTNIYSAMAGRVLGTRNIGAIRSDLNSEISGDRVFGKWQIALPQHLIANSQLAVDRAISLGRKPEKIDVVKNIVELPDGVTDALSVKKKDVKVLFVGRLGTEKRPAWFIKLASHIRNDLPGSAVSFRIAGDGPLRSELEKLRHSYDLSDDEVEFLGEREDLAGIYRNADILVLTSDFEGTPNVILEAMSFGIPVVATQVGGVPDILTTESGILVDRSDFQGLVDATTKLILDPELRLTLGRNGKDFVARNHSLNYLQKRLVEIYQRLLRNPVAHD